MTPQTIEERFGLFVSLISKINRSIRRIKDFEMRDVGLRGIHVMILFNLKESAGGLTQAELADVCGEDKASISRTIAWMQERGLVRSDEAGRRRRNVALTLTEEGREKARFLAERIVSAVNAGSSGLREPERGDLYESLTRVDRNLAAYLASMKRSEAAAGGC